MKGLLLKDFYIASKSCRTFLFICLVFIICSCFNEFSFFAFYPAIVCSMLAVNIIAYEESSKWTMYVHTLPVSRRMAVDEKYILTLILILAVLVLSVIAQIIFFATHGGLIFSRILMVIAIIVLASCIGPALLLPITFKLGVIKGRMYYYIVIGVLCGACVIIATQTNGMETLANLEMNTSGTVLSLVVILASFILFFISWGVSRKVYETREL